MSQPIILDRDNLLRLVDLLRESFKEVEKDIPPGVLQSVRIGHRIAVDTVEDIALLMPLNTSGSD